MISTKNIVISTNHERPIVADITFDDTIDNLPIVIFCHGYKGFKDWGAWHLVAEKFAQKGFCFLKFNFSYNGGTVDQPIDFPDLDAFGQNTFSREIEDIGFVLDYITTINSSISLDTSNITLIGHSRGGGISIIRAAIDDRVTRLVSWAAIAEIERRFPQGDLMDQWKKNGVRYVINGRTLQEMPHYYSFYQDYLDNKSLLNIKAACEKISIPHLIINGTLDKSVKPEEAKLLHSWNPKSELVLVSKAGHTFGSKHPWVKSEIPLLLDIITQKTIAFISDSKKH